MPRIEDTTLAPILLLPELSLRKIVLFKPWGLGLVVEKNSTFEICPKCATKSTSVYDHRRARFKDEPIRGKGVILLANKRRFLCRACKSVFTEPIPGISKYKRTTNRYQRGLRWAAETYSTMKAVQKNFRCSAGTCFKAVYSELKRRVGARRYPLPEALGIDEHSVRKPRHKGVEFATILVDHKNHRVYDLIDDHSKEGLTAAIGKMEGQGNVKFVTIDLSPTFKSVVRQCFPNAQIVADRFHVQRLFSRAVNAARKKATGDKRKNPIRKLLLRNGDDLELHERSAVWQWLNQNPLVREVYEYKEAMRRIYRYKGPEKASVIFQRLLERMKASKQERVISLRKTLFTWRREILAYHTTGLSNGRVEGFNRKAKLIQRGGYGVRKFENYRWKLLNACF